MTVYYLDSSAWVKRYCQEPGSAWVAALFAHAPTLACCAFGIVEVTAALARKAKAGELDAPVYRAKLALADSDWSGFMALDLTVEVLERAKGVARDRALRAADAIHLAATLILRRDFADPGDQMIIVTSDHELEAAAIAEGIPTIDPVVAERAGAAP